MKTKNTLTINKMLFKMFLEQNANKTCGDVFELSGSDKEYFETKIADLDLNVTNEYIQMNNIKYLNHLCNYEIDSGTFNEFADFEQIVNILDFVKFEDAI